MRTPSTYQKEPFLLMTLVTIYGFSNKSWREKTCFIYERDVYKSKLYLSCKTLTNQSASKHLVQKLLNENAPPTDIMQNKRTKICTVGWSAEKILANSEQQQSCRSSSHVKLHVKDKTTNLYNMLRQKIQKPLHLIEWISCFFGERLFTSRI